jgi:hypothetical protein
MKHTPTPWTCEDEEMRDDAGRYLTQKICDAKGRVIVEFSNSGVAVVETINDYRWDSQAQFDAEHIVRCVNAYDDMLDALKRANQFIVNGVEVGRIFMPASLDDPAHDTRPKIRAAIEKAEAAQR